MTSGADERSRRRREFLRIALTRLVGLQAGTRHTVPSILIRTSCTYQAGILAKVTSVRDRVCVLVARTRRITTDAFLEIVDFACATVVLSPVGTH
jgi:hypothetical protein